MTLGGKWIRFHYVTFEECIDINRPRLLVAGRQAGIELLYSLAKEQAVASSERVYLRPTVHLVENKRHCMFGAETEKVATTKKAKTLKSLFCIASSTQSPSWCHVHCGADGELNR